MDRRFVIALSILTFFHTLRATAQPPKHIIHLQNPSFEDIPRCCTAPSKWESTGNVTETPPDIQPGYFNVTVLPKQGNTYLGLVVRDNDTYEGVSQRVSQPMKKDYCYKFSIWLCRSELYLSTSHTTGKPANFSTPAKLSVYAGNNYGDKQQQIALSVEIVNKDWKQYNFEFKPNQEYSYITIEATHKKPVLFPYNGNVLVDNMSDLVGKKCSKDNDRDIAAANKKPKDNKKPDSTRRPDSGAIANNTKLPNSNDKTYTGTTYNRAKMKVGQTIRIEKLYFDADSTNIKSSSYPVLDELYQFMSSNTDVSIEVGGHTNDIPAEFFCDKLSTARAKAVADYLIKKGIHDSRVQYKGYGKRNPLFPNVTPENRKRNQRVEIKILSIG